MALYKEQYIQDNVRTPKHGIQLCDIIQRTAYRRTMLGRQKLGSIKEMCPIHHKILLCNKDVQRKRDILDTRIVVNPLMIRFISDLSLKSQHDISWFVNIRLVFAQINPQPTEEPWIYGPTHNNTTFFLYPSRHLLHAPSLTKPPLAPFTPPLTYH